MHIVTIFRVIFYCAVLYCILNICKIILDPSLVFSIEVSQDKSPVNNISKRENFSVLYNELSTIMNNTRNFTISFDNNTKQLQFKNNNNQFFNFQRQLSIPEEQILKKTIILNNFFDTPNLFVSDNKSTAYHLTIILGHVKHSVSWSDSSFYLPSDLPNIANAIRSLAFESILRLYYFK